MMRRFSHPSIPPSPLPKEAGNASEESYLTTQHSRRLRRESTTPERILWSLLRNRKLAGLKFRREHPIGPYFADFYCDEANLVVESDSRWHDGRKEYDAKRDDWMRERGIRVLRVCASGLAGNESGVLRAIEAAARAAMEESATDQPFVGQDSKTRKKA